ncbi:DUF551 domain-containing protein [Cronobacter sakazakii]|nr:DUF551 domain-containing protein [Cronobacter sakazakii]
MSTISNERLESLQRQFKEEGFNDIRDSEVMQLVEENLALRKERERAEPVVVPDLHKVVYHFRDLNEGFPVERFKADYVISWMLANYPPAPSIADDSLPYDPQIAEYEQMMEAEQAQADTTSQQFESLAGKAVVPEGWKLMPMRLTAENGAKGALSGEFSETKFVNCPECFGDGECETCDGSGRIEITVPVTWSTIKEIWAKGVEHFATSPQSPGNDHATVSGRWIPCSERMPGIGEAVLMRISCSDYFNIESGRYKGDGLWLGCWFSTYGKKESPYQVAHWMPIPAAPEPCK